MPKSGIKLTQDLITLFKEMKEGVKGKKTIRSLWFKIDGNDIVLDKRYEKDPEQDEKAEYDSIIAELKDDEARFILFDMKHGQKDKLFLASWCPDSCPPKTKMMCSATLQDVISQLDNIPAFQWSDRDEASYASLQETMTNKFNKYN